MLPAHSLSSATAAAAAAAGSAARPPPPAPPPRARAALADEDVEGLLIGPIGDRVALKVVSTSRGGGGGGGAELGEVLRQRVGKVVVWGDVSGRGGGGLGDRGQDQRGLRRWLFWGGRGGEMRGRACTVWDCERGGVWGRGSGGLCVEEGERVVEVEMGRVRSEEAVWGKVLFSKRGRADLRYANNRRPLQHCNGSLLPLQSPLTLVRPQICQVIVGLFCSLVALFCLYSRSLFTLVRTPDLQEKAPWTHAKWATSEFSTSTQGPCPRLHKYSLICCNRALLPL
jgi:hypothetical protein